MKIPSNLKGSRLNVTRTAELFCMDPGHLRRLCRRGVLPSPKRTAKGMPYYDFDLLKGIGEVLRSGVGVNKEEISFYRRKSKSHRNRRGKANGRKQTGSSFIDSVIQGCLQLGIAKNKLDVGTVSSIITEEFGKDKPDLREALPVVARRILAEE